MLCVYKNNNNNNKKIEETPSKQIMISLSLYMCVRVYTSDFQLGSGGGQLRQNVDELVLVVIGDGGRFCDWWVLVVIVVVVVINGWWWVAFGS